MAGFCTQCGAQLEDDASFCTACGSSVTVQQEPEPVLAVPTSQPVAAQTNYSQTNSGNKAIIALLLVIILLLLAGGGYMFYQNQQAANVSLSDEREKPAVTVQDKKSQEAGENKEQRRAYVKKAIADLTDNEEALSNLAAMINSGQNNSNDLLKMESHAMNNIQKRHNELNAGFNINDSELIEEVEALFSFQEKRAECMRQGIMGNSDQYRIGSQYYDQFQSRFKKFKGSYNP